MPMSAPRSRSARHSSTERSTGWWSSKAASPVNDRRMTWLGHARDVGVDVAEEAGRVGQAGAAEEVAASGPVTLIAASDIVRSRTWTRRPQSSIQSRTHISALAAPPDVNDSTNRVSDSRRIIPSSMTWPRSLRSSA